MAEEKEIGMAESILHEFFSEIDTILSTEPENISRLIDLKQQIQSKTDKIDQRLYLSHDLFNALLEHFSVLQQASMGDLKAKFKDAKSGTLLKSLQEYTDRMVETVSREINQRIQTEKSLQNSHKELQKILFSLPTGLVIIDADSHKILEANPLAISLIGVPKERIVGAICHEFICPAEKDKCPVTTGGWEGDASERLLLTHDGTKLPIYKSVIRETINGKKCLVESFVDMSKQKIAERELTQKEKLEGIIEMAGAVCHELNQPLQGIFGYIELLQLDIPLDAPALATIEKIRKQVDKMAEITSKLMNITKYETKKYLDGKIVDIDRAST